ncbi:NlpC/P60 family protein [Modestobacter sp. NPDC049651]|uniref:C40 family peptidase n=1 Tax=unclassified Modestobacter TaxID=2643866 RepID=UPI0033E61EB6
MRAWVGTQVGSGRRGSGRWLRRTAGTAAIALVCSVGASLFAPGVASAAPVNPSDQQLQQAEQAKADAAQRVGEIRGQLASLQASADAAHQDALIALEDYEEKQQAAEAAQQQADDAAAASAQAAADLQTGRDEVAAFARQSYIQGTTSPGTVALLSAGGPAQLLERAALLDAAGEHRTDVVAQLTVLQTQATAADQAAQSSLGEARELQTQAAGMLESAQQQEQAARAQADDLAVQQTALQTELDKASQALYGLQGARAAAQQWAAQQAAAAAARPAASRATTAPAPASTSSSGSSSSGSSSSGSSSSGSASSGSASGGSSSGSSSSGSSSSASSSSGSPSKGSPSSGGSSAGAPAGSPSTSAVQKAIAAARSQIGVLYSWGGGGSNGPSYGIPPDADVWGFDCSGLTQYAYAKAGIAIGGTSRDQWWLNRSKQVDADDLQPGDLLFYASGSAYTSIYHVAMYLGGNQMIEAPDRGKKVTTSSLRFGRDYYGAVRPSA